MVTRTASITNEKQKDDESWREPIWFLGETERFEADGKVNAKTRIGEALANGRETGVLNDDADADG